MDILHNINTLMKDRGVSAYKLSKDVGISSGLMSQWKKGMQKPSLDVVARIAAYFNVTTDFLLDMADDPAPPRTKKAADGDITFDDFEYALYGEVRELDDEEKAELLKNARRMNELRKLRNKEQNKPVNPNG